MNYLIGSGYHYRSEWDADMSWAWAANMPSDSKAVVVSTGAWFPPKINSGIHDIDLVCGDNLGHVGELVDGKRDNELCGWSASVSALAMIAYNHNKDLIFKEQDCLAFGPWVEQMYADLGDRDMVFGAAHTGPPWMPVSQSLFLIRHSYLLQFVRRYLEFTSDATMLPEQKFAAMEEREPDRFARLSFGVDRQRPIPWDAPVWYAQQWTQEELDEAERRGLL